MIPSHECLQSHYATGLDIDLGLLYMRKNWFEAIASRSSVFIATRSRTSASMASEKKR